MHERWTHFSHNISNFHLTCNIKIWVGFLTTQRLWCPGYSNQCHKGDDNRRYCIQNRIKIHILLFRVSLLTITLPMLPDVITLSIPTYIFKSLPDRAVHSTLVVLIAYTPITIALCLLSSWDGQTIKFAAWLPVMGSKSIYMKPMTLLNACLPQITLVTLNLGEGLNRSVSIIMRLSGISNKGAADLVRQCWNTVKSPWMTAHCHK